MANAFNLTAQINLQGPSNIKSVVAGIKKELGTINADVNLKIDNKAVASVKKITSELKLMNSVLVSASSNAANLNRSFSSLSNALGRAGQATKAINVGLGGSTKSLQGVASASKQAANSIDTLGKNARSTAKRFLIYTAVTRVFYSFTNAIDVAFRRYVEFDKQLIRLQQVTRSGSIGISGITKEIDRLSVSLGVSTEKLTQTAVTLAQAGFTADETRAALAALAKTELAPTFDDITQTTEGAIAAIRQFGLETTQLESILGSINAVAGRFAVESSDIIAAIQRTGGVFASASKGVKNLDGSLKTGEQALQDFVAVFTSVRATTRESAETIATGLRTIFTRIQRGSTIEYLKQFNIELQDLEGNFVGPYEAVRRLSSGLKDLDPRDVRFNRIVEELGGFRQIGKVIPLLQNFADAERALAVAQSGTQSLEGDRIKGLQSLAVQLARVNEQAFSLFKTIGDSKVFRGFLSVVLSLASGLLSLAKTFKPLLPFLAVLGTIKIAKSAFNFASGAAGAIKAGGGAKGVGAGIGRSLTGTTDNKKDQSVGAITQNTSALKSLTNAILNLTNRINRSPGPRGFATGGIVPGSGNRDTVPAMLTPGEFVIRKKAVETLGAGNLHKMNKYADGGKILKQDTIGAAILEPGSASRFITTKDITSSIKDKDKKQKLSNILQGKNYNFETQGLGPDVSEFLDQAIKKNTADLIDNISNDFNENFKGTPVNAPKISRENGGLSNFISNINDGLRGSIFEAFITNVKSSSGKYSEQTTAERNAPFDTTNGLGPASKLYPKLEGVDFVDLKATLEGANIPSISRKIGNTILDDSSLTEQDKANVVKSSDSTRTLKDIILSNFTGVRKDRKLPLYESKGRIAGLQGNIEEAFKEAVSQGLAISAEDFDNKILELFKEQSGQNIRGFLLQPKAMGGFIQKFAEGGSPEDTVPALLTPGEFVINKKAAARIGASNLHRMNRADKIQGYNSGGSVGFIQRFAGGGGVDDPAILDVFKDAAEKAGQTLEQFSKTLKDAAKQNYELTKQQIKNTRADLKTNIIKTRVGGLNSEDDVQNFQRDLGAQLAGILGDNISGERLQDALDEIAIGLMDNKSLPELIKTIPELASAFDEGTDSYRANFRVQKELESEYGGLINAVRLSAKDLAEIEWRKEGGAEKLGGIGKIFDAAKGFGIGGGAYEFSQSDTGKKLTDLQKKYDNFGKSVITKIGGVSPALGKFAGGLSSFSKVLGGMPTVVAAATSVLSDQLLPSLLSFTGLSGTATGAGIQQGISQGASQSAAFAAIGNALMPGIGGLIMGITGAISGAITGFIQGFRTKKLENSINKLNGTMKQVDKTFADYEAVQSAENLDRIYKSVADANVASMALEEQGRFTQGDRLRQGATGAINAGAMAGGAAAILAVAGVLTGGAALAIAGTAAALYGLFSYITAVPDELDNQALEAYLGNLGEFNKAIEGLARINLEKQTIDQLDRALTAIKSGDLSSSALVQEGEKAGLSRNDVFRRAAQERLYEQSGGNIDLYRRTVSDMGGEDSQQVLELGKEIVKQKTEQLLNEQRQAALLRDVNIEVENILDQFQKLNAVIKRVGSDLDELDKSIEDQMSSLRGEGRVREAGRRDINILQNARGYSAEEVRGAAARAGNIIGGERGRQVQSAVESKRILDEELPKILQTANSQNVDEVIGKIDEALVAGSIDRDTANLITADLEKALNAKIGSRQGISLSELSEDVPALTASLKALDEQNKAAVAASELFAKALDQSTKYANEYIKALDEARERELAGIKAKIEGENRIAEALGKRLTMEQRTADFFAEFDSLAPGMREGGQIDIAKVVAERERVRGQITDLEKTKANTDPQNTVELVKLQEQLAKLNSTDANLVKSLEFVADSNQLLTAALNAYQERIQKEDRQIGALDKVLTGSPEDIFGLSADVSAFNTALSGDAESRRMLFSTQEGRESSMRGSQFALDLIGTDTAESRQIQAQMRLNMAESMGPGMQEMLDQSIMGMDGTETTLRKILEQRADPTYRSPEEKDAQAALDLQKQANNALVTMQSEQASLMQSKIGDPIVNAIELLPAAIASALAADQTAGGAGGRTAGAGSGAGTTGAGTGAGTGRGAGTETTMSDQNFGLGNVATAAIVADTLSGGAGRRAVASTVGRGANAFGAGYSRGRAGGAGRLSSAARGLRGAGNQLTRGRLDRGIGAIRNRLGQVRNNIPTPNQAGLAVRRGLDAARARVPTPNQAGLAVRRGLDAARARVPTPNQAGLAVRRGLDAVRARVSTPNQAGLAVRRGLDAARTGGRQAVTFGREAGKQMVRQIVPKLASVRTAATTANVVRGAGSVARATPGALAANTAISAVTNAYELATDPQAYADKMDAAVEDGFRKAINGSNQFTNSLSGGLEGLSDPIGKIVEGGFALKALGDDLAALKQSALVTQQMEATVSENKSSRSEAALGEKSYLKGLSSDVQVKVQEIARQEKILEQLQAKIDAGQGFEIDEDSNKTNFQLASYSASLIEEERAALEELIRVSKTPSQGTGGRVAARRGRQPDNKAIASIREKVEKAISQEKIVIEIENSQNQPVTNVASTIPQSVSPVESPIPSLSNSTNLTNLDIPGFVTTLEDVDSSLQSLTSVFNLSTTAFEQIKSYLDSYTVPLVLDEQSTSALSSFNADFNRYVTELSKINLPDTITINARHTVVVDIRGAEVFAQLDEGLQKTVVAEVNRELNRQTDGALGRNYQA